MATKLTHRQRDLIEWMQGKGPLSIHQIASGFYESKWWNENAGPFRRLGWTKPMVKALVDKGALREVLRDVDRGDGVIWRGVVHYEVSLGTGE